MSNAPSSAPLADRMRPRTLNEYVGQAHLIGEGTLLRRAIEDDTVGSMLFWGPPGSGKTTLAKVIAGATRRAFVGFSAVLQGVKEVRIMVSEARARLQYEQIGTILFVDEIHRFNKAQQDAFLPHVESGVVTLIGATTENPSFSVNSALLSRCRTYVLNPLSNEDIDYIVGQALEDAERGLAGLQPCLGDESRAMLVDFANGDARAALNALELAVCGTRADEKGERHVDLQTIKEAITRNIAYDNEGEEHYNLISALHKSIRGSDPQAALYWLARMVEGGADPLYICRRLVRMASEDIGLADPQALQQALAARDAAHFLGYPECDVALAQATVYLATAPKSNSLETAMHAARHEVHARRNEPVPLNIRNAPTKLMSELGYGEEYIYDHDAPDHYAGQTFLPDALQGTHFYKPGEFGFEKEIQKRLEYWARLRKERRGGNES